MFDFVRKHTKIMMGVMFLLIIPSFVLFGIEGYTRFREGGETVARVAGQDITKAEWDSAHKQDVDRMRASMPTLDASLLESEQARYSSLERLVQQRVLSTAADKVHLLITDQRLAFELQQNPTIASLKRADGSLDLERYQQLLSGQGMTPAMFEARMRSEIALRQVMGAITGTGPGATVVADAALGAFFQRREVQIARFDSAEFKPKVNLTEADLEAYHKAHPAEFQAQEQAAIEYITLDLAAVEKGLSVDEGEMKTYFEQNAAQLAGKEERRASHILINAPTSASDADKKKARALAAELLAQVRKSPDRFAEIARKSSQDPGSAAAGGDLDFFGRGAMVKPFEDAVFAMKKGEISDLVESEFGLHIIQLTDVRAPKQRSFAEMRPEIEALLRKQQAQRKFAEAAETFTNTVYEQADSLKPAADKLKLEIRTATLNSRTPASDSKGPLANAKFLKLIFSADALEKKRNTEAVEFGSSQLVAGRVVSHTPARSLPLAEVRDKVRERLVMIRAAELAKKEGETQLAAWKVDAAGAKLAPAVVLSRDQPQQQPIELVAAVMRAELGSAPTWLGIDLGEGGYAVARVSRIVPRDTVAAERLRQERDQYREWWVAAEGRAYYQWLKDRLKVEIKVAKPTSELTASSIER